MDGTYCCEIHKTSNKNILFLFAIIRKEYEQNVVALNCQNTDTAFLFII